MRMIGISHDRWKGVPRYLGLGLGLLAGTALLPGCQSADARDIFQPSVADQKKIGAEAAKEVAQRYKIVKDNRADRFQKIGARLTAALQGQSKKQWDYKFNVIESKEVNAFALPGGPIYIYTGLLERLETDDKLAAVTAHEMAHVYGEHWARQVAAQQKRQAGLAVLLGVANADKTWYDVAGVVDGVVGLKYSRKDENNSDADGLTNMVAAGYNPRGMVGLFQELQAASGSSSMPGFLRSHPDTNERIRKTEERIAKMKTTK